MAERQQVVNYRRQSRVLKLKRRIALAKKRIRRFRMLIRVALIFGLLYVSYRAMNFHFWYLNPNDLMDMNPNVIKIEGNEIAPERKISDILRTQEPPDEQIYKYSTKSIEQSLLTIETIKKAYVRRFWFPARLIVYVEERTPVFSIAPNPESMPISAITSDGHYIGSEYMPIPSKFKTTKILSYGVGGDDYEKWNQARVDDILKFIKLIEAYSKEKIEYLDLRNQNDIYVKLQTVLLRLGAIDDTIEDRIKSVPTILPQINTLHQKVKYVDLRWDTNYIKLDDGRTTLPVKNQKTSSKNTKSFIPNNNVPQEESETVETVDTNNEEPAQTE